MSRPEEDAAIEIAREALRGSDVDGRTTPALVRDGEFESADADTVEVPVPIAEAAESTTIRVLHVDDDQDILDLTETCLERVDDDFRVHTESTVVEGLEYLRDAPVDCIISDYEMPRTDGLEFLTQVRERHPDLPFILYTGQGNEQIASDAIAAGVTDYMQKGSGTDQYEVLSNRVRNAVEQYRTQEQFWNALSWYQRLVEQSIAGVFVVQDGNLVYVNERLADIFGYDRHELLGEPFGRLVTAEDRGRVLDRLHQNDPNGDEARLTFSGRRGDGTTVDVDVTGGLTTHDGAPAVTGIVRPASE